MGNGDCMDFIEAPSLINDFWNTTFYELLIFTFCILELRFVLGRSILVGCITRYGEKIKDYSHRIKSIEQLNKAMPVVIVFLLLSLLHFIYLVFTCFENFFYLGFSFKHDMVLTEDVVLSVWKYRPDVENVDTLNDIILYYANQNGLNTTRILSPEGFAHLPLLVLEAMFSFTIVLILFLLGYWLIRLFNNIIKKCAYKSSDNPINIGRALLRSGAILCFVALALSLICYINRYENDIKNANAWRRYQMELVSSGAPPEAEIGIETEKQAEVREWIENHNSNTCIYFHLGSMSYSVSFTESGPYFQKNRSYYSI